MQDSEASNGSLITNRALLAVASELGTKPSELQMESVGGGYSRNRRSLVGLGDEWIFVKEVDTKLLPDDGRQELWWLQKDYLVTQRLLSTAPEFVPKWSKIVANGHVLMMASYRSSDGWLWSPPKDRQLQSKYIQAVVAATKKLETVELDNLTIEKLKLQPFFRDQLAYDDGFETIISDDTMKSQLVDKYNNLLKSRSGVSPKHLEGIIKLLQDSTALDDLAAKAAQLAEQPNGSFGHCDVRSDNLAFHPESGEVKLVDWNWASYTPSNFGATEFLIDMARRGADVSAWADSLNPELLAASTGYYLKRCLNEEYTAGSNLRQMQAESAAVALSLWQSTQI